MNIQLLYFSPTHSTKKAGEFVAGGAARELGQTFTAASATLPLERETPPKFEDSLIVCAFPVYAGRVPAPFAQFLERISCRNCHSLPIAVYGNRAIDDALLEAAAILAAHGAPAVAAIAAVAQHTFDPAIASGRPNEQDKKRLEEFGRQIAAKIADDNFTPPNLPGQFPYKQPKPAAEVLPLTSDACNHCGICVKVCPMGVIDPKNEHIINPGCILCSACVKFCPQIAKLLPEAFLTKIRQMLAKVASEPREPQLFL